LRDGESGYQVGRKEEEKEKIDTLPVQPARNEHIIKHSRDCEPSGWGEKRAGSENTRDKRKMSRDYFADMV